MVAPRVNGSLASINAEHVAEQTESTGFQPDI